MLLSSQQIWGQAIDDHEPANATRTFEEGKRRVDRGGMATNMI